MSLAVPASLPSAAFALGWGGGGRAAKRLIFVIPSITTPGLSRHTIPWTSCAPLCLPSVFAFVRSILRPRDSFRTLRWNNAGSTNHLSGNCSQDSHLRSPYPFQGGGLPTRAWGSVTACHRVTRACPHVEPAPRTSTHCGASNTTSPPVAAPPSPWPPHDGPCAPIAVCTRA